MVWRTTTVVLVVLVGVAPAGGVPVAAGHGAVAHDPGVVSTPVEPGAVAPGDSDNGTSPAVRANLTVRRASPNGTVLHYAYEFEVGPNVTHLQANTWPNATAVEFEGFRRDTEGYERGEANYVWTGNDSPRIVFAVDYADWSGSRVPGVFHEDWVFAFVPEMRFSWTADGSSTEVTNDDVRSRTGWSATAVDGVVAPELFVYLGPYEVVSRTYDDERFRIVFPDPADEGLREHLDAVAAIARDFRGDGRSVLGIAAPLSYDEYSDEDVILSGVGRPGGESGDAFFVHAGYRDRVNVLLEEVIHTYQRHGGGPDEYEMGEDMVWFAEAYANYYQQLYAFRADVISGRALINRLTRPTVYTNDVLADPSTWEGSFTQYGKGRKVVAYLDWWIRHYTGNRTMRDVSRRLAAGDEHVSVVDFQEAIAAVVGNDSLSDDVERYVESEAFPDRAAYPIPREVTNDTSVLTSRPPATPTTTPASTQTPTPTPTATPNTSAPATVETTDGGQSQPGLGVGVAALAVVLGVVVVLWRR